MAHSMIAHAGRMLRHAVGVLLLCWFRALRAAAFTALLGMIVIEIGAIVITHHFPPDGAAQLVAVAFAGALAFGVALTVVLDELIAGIIEIMGVLRGEAETGARAAAVVAQREVGESSAAIFHRLGLSTLVASPTPSPVPQSAPPTPPPVSRPVSDWPDEEATATGETLAELAVSPADSPARQEARPVRADLLPRLSWTDEHPAVRPQTSPTSAPLTADASDPTAEAAPVEESAPEPIASTPSPVADAETPILAEPSVWHTDDAPAPDADAWHDPLAHAEQPTEEEDAGIQPVDAFGAPPPAATARPHSADTRPLPETEQRYTMWDHISHVLAGRPVELLPQDEGDAAEDAVAAPHEDTPPGV